MRRIGDPTPPRRHGAGTWPAWLLAQGVLYALWVGAFQAARWMEYAPHASLWFPPAAVTFAGFALFGRRALPALLAGAITGSLLTSDGYAALDAGQRIANLLLFPLVHCLAYALAAAIMLRAIGRGDTPSMVRAVGGFLIGGMLAAAAAALGGAWVTHLAGMLPRDRIADTVMPWLIGDYAALIALGPLLVAALRALAQRLRLPSDRALTVFEALPRPPPAPARFLPKLALVLGLVAASLLAVSAAPHREPLLIAVFLAIVLQLWIVHTQGMLESLLAVALFSTLLAVLVDALGLDRHALTLQFAMITLSAGSYFGLAVPVLYTDNANLRRLLTHDAMTGAHSRQVFAELAQQALRASQRRGMPTTLLMIDLDNLKLLNDRHGHAAGDRALIEVVRACQASMRPTDLIGRLGGDEFCVLLPGLERPAALAVVGDVMSRLRDASSDTAPRISIGIAVTESDDDRYDDLMARADAALYAAKRGGRDRVAAA